MDDMQALQQRDHAEDRGVVRPFAARGGLVLNLLERKRASGLEEHLKDAPAASRHAHPFPAQAVEDRVDSE